MGPSDDTPTFVMQVSTAVFVRNIDDGIHRTENGPGKLSQFEPLHSRKELQQLDCRLFDRNNRFLPIGQICFHRQAHHEDGVIGVPGKFHGRRTDAPPLSPAALGGPVDS